ncbi:hypothetical protein DDU33_07665 [Actinobacillus porcitonsillarum]|uniref:Uncharacterized protein n=1 Tax=Actinobacillus porcitonsillarum TaxID=189834 RepID=A0A2U8FK58_9PAST|nr:hypothetical protein [Actinobacillus porcitonsillarum]AWI51369.1 hypothetical protein DDU33_07665 [Actinobacillus porcitonsillarum]
MSEKSENCVTREEFEQFVQYNEQRYSSLFNRVLGLDMVVRSLVLPLATTSEVAEKAKDIIDLLDNIKSNLLQTGGIAPEHQKDIFFSLDLTLDMLQNVLKKLEVGKDEP